MTSKATDYMEGRKLPASESHTPHRELSQEPKVNSIPLIKKRKESANNVVDRNVVRKFAFSTRMGINSQGITKTNQDAFILQPNLKKESSLHFFAVCDGHGTLGD